MELIEDPILRPKITADSMTPQDDITKRSISFFSQQWATIKNYDKDKEEENKESLENKLKSLKSTKAKGTSLGDKVNNANIKVWKDQKLLLAGFFEFNKTLFRDPSQIKATFGELEKKPDIFNGVKNWENLEEDDTEFNKGGSVSTDIRKELEEYGNKVKQAYMINGLSIEEAKLRRQFDGPNTLPEKKKTPEIIKLIREMTNVFSLLLWAASALSFIGYGLDTTDYSNLYLAIVIILIILITGFFSYFQNRKSDAILDSFKGFSISQVTVIRNGTQMKISALDLVRGDLVQIKGGEKIPADVRMLEVSDMEVDEAALTGESLPVKKKMECGEKGKDNPLEARNLAFFSTLCKQGRGTGIVIRIGADTFMGKIADLASTAEASITTLQKEIDHFIKLIATVAVSFGIVFFILGLIIKYPIITNFIFALGIIVANVPEGLMSTVTISLAITAKKMLRRQIMVKNLQSVETLGAITCICSDKTGTLTQNKMSVVHMWYDMEIKKMREDQEKIRIDFKDVPMTLYDTTDESFETVRFAAVCGSSGKFLTLTPEDYLPLIQERNAWQNDHPQATFEEICEVVNKLKIKFQDSYTKEFLANIDERITDTDPTESGILKIFEKTEPIDKIRERYPLHYSNGGAVQIPFNSSLKFACFLRRVPDKRDSSIYTFQLAVKGAPEQILKKCNRYLYKGQEMPMTEQFQKEFQQANKTFALKGERVIGMAMAKLDPAKFNMNYHFKNDADAPPEGTRPQASSGPKPNYPIDNLCFVGICAMEDPPRPGVKEAIATCKLAGIKVIMVTGDQTLTAASIAYQIGIIEDLDDAPEIIQAKEKLATIEEAEAKSNTIIISGDRLAHNMKIDETLSEDNPRKGAYLRNWLMKRDVVFARTSPEQKLVIVDGCQKLQHVVAVTGDGVNDSPAIKKADIGIAMGKVGTDVAKDAADILLLDDNFANIVRGIKQGRVIFDLLKKIIGYCLTSNIPELIPFLGFVILQFPLPLTTILILCIDVGTDVFPNICFAYEAPEADLMAKQPRNVNTDKLCTMKLFSYGYIFMGMIECSGCFLTYFVVLHDYGFKPTNLFFFTFVTGIEPSKQDIFNPYDNSFKGNSRAFMSSFAEQLSLNGESHKVIVDQKHRQLNWASEADIDVDQRVFYYDKQDDFWASCTHDSVGHSYDGPVCYRVEALRHAQAAFLLTVVTLQISNACVWRTKSASIFTHLYKNHYLNSAFLVEIALIMMILYIPGLNTAFGTRPIRFEHFIPPLPVFITLLTFGEFTKLLIRNVKQPDGSPGFFYKYFSY